MVPTRTTILADASKLGEAEREPSRSFNKKLLGHDPPPPKPQDDQYDEYGEEPEDDDEGDEP